MENKRRNDAAFRLKAINLRWDCESDNKETEVSEDVLRLFNSDTEEDDFDGFSAQEEDEKGDQIAVWMASWPDAWTTSTGSFKCGEAATLLRAPFLCIYLISLEVILWKGSSSQNLKCGNVVY